MRIAKYHDADSLIDNCTINRETWCWVWPEVNLARPLINPHGYLSRLLSTNSVPRILFTILKHPPASRRLVQHCNTNFCVNPFHFTESYDIVKKRQSLEKMGLPANTPIKGGVDRSAYPDDEVLRTLMIKNPVHIQIVTESATRAGQYARGIKNMPAKPTAPRPKIKIAIKREMPKQVEPSDEDKRLADMDLDQIFDAVMMRKKRKMLEDWDDTPSAPKNGAGA
jgi:hypothetical protein